VVNEKLENAWIQVAGRYGVETKEMAARGKYE
jgi:hypothetical protein